MSQAASPLELEIEEEITEAQRTILAKFAAIQAELEKLVHKTRQTRKHVKKK